MAFESGTATDHEDLLDKLVTFLTTNVDLTNAGQAWSVIADRAEPLQEFEGNPADRVVYFQGPGLAGLDEIHVNISTYKNTGGDYFNWAINGSTGFNASEISSNQPGARTSDCAMLLWDSTIPYWFVANGRRFIVVAKVSTVFESLYGGFILPHATPAEFPYPLFLGGTHFEMDSRWSATDPAHKAFWNPTRDGSSGAGASATAGLRTTGGDWQLFGNYGNQFDTTLGQIAKVWPYATWVADQRDTFNASDYVLLPLTLHSSENEGNVYGEIDGVFYVSGFSSASENIITIAGEDYLVVQNTFRTAVNHYAAVKLV